MVDRLVRGIADWEAAHPGQVLPDSPTGKVAGGAVEGDVPHTVPMLSLDNVFSAEEFTAWTASLARRVGPAPRRPRPPTPFPGTTARPRRRRRTARWPG
ncbi:hypothetical protein [Streptomyces griseomycini]|uniref:NAD-dependent DNA ligase n=1 Tax=Streptomyces griseomycini TaxID=66895 RepID=A0A7W7M044_9ACTN|nr:NAD-dependent DNA ligase [Streptomyces griseomycini]GGR07901.1 hypothetical protein GCM10015536_11230 [Streptomyces griseomycini]